MSSSHAYHHTFHHMLYFLLFISFFFSRKVRWQIYHDLVLFHICPCITHSNSCFPRFILYFKAVSQDWDHFFLHVFFSCSNFPSMNTSLLSTIHIHVCYLPLHFINTYMFLFTLHIYLCLSSSISYINYINIFITFSYSRYSCQLKSYEVQTINNDDLSNNLQTLVFCLSLTWGSFSFTRDKGMIIESLFYQFRQKIINGW